jgi:hypothetical protein
MPVSARKRQTAHLDAQHYAHVFRKLGQQPLKSCVPQSSAPLIPRISITSIRCRQPRPRATTVELRRLDVLDLLGADWRA